MGKERLKGLARVRVMDVDKLIDRFADMRIRW